LGAKTKILAHISQIFSAKIIVKMNSSREFIEGIFREECAKLNITIIGIKSGMAFLECRAGTAIVTMPRSIRSLIEGGVMTTLYKTVFGRAQRGRFEGTAHTVSMRNSLIAFEKNRAGHYDATR